MEVLNGTFSRLDCHLSDTLSKLSVNMIFFGF